MSETLSRLQKSRKAGYGARSEVLLAYVRLAVLLLSPQASGVRQTAETRLRLSIIAVRVSEICSP